MFRKCLGSVPVLAWSVEFSDLFAPSTKQRETSMTRNILLSLLLVSATSSNAADKSNEELSATLQWHMSLDAAGQITALEAKGKPIDALREKLEPAVRSWKFEPGTVNGEPAVTDTVLTVQVQLDPIPRSDELSVRVVDARTGGGVGVTRNAPHFPKSAMRQMARDRTESVERVVLSIAYDASGEPQDISVVADSSSKQKSLVDASIAAARDWKIEPEHVAGIGVAGTLVSPLCYFTAKSVAEANRKSALCTWHVPNTQTVLGQGQSVTLESSVTLKSDVIGSTL
jgi:hypothetical protein